MEPLRTSVFLCGKPYHAELLSAAIKKKRAKVRAEGLPVGPWSSQSRSRSQAHCAQQAHGHCLEGGPTVDLLLLLAAIPETPLSFPLSQPLLPNERICRLMNCHLQGGGRSQIPVFLKQRRINEPLRVVSELELSSVSARAGDGLPTRDRRTATKLWSCCPVCDLSGFVCDPLCPVVQVTG